MCASFLEFKPQDSNRPLVRFCQLPDGFISRKLSVGFVVCPCNQLSRAIAIGGGIELGCGLVPSLAGRESLRGSEERKECESALHAVAVLIDEIRAAAAGDNQGCGLFYPYRRTPARRLWPRSAEVREDDRLR
jgi:hypothetical protein